MKWRSSTPCIRLNFLYVDRYVFRSGWIYPNSYIPYTMVRYILKGSAEFILNGKSFYVHEKQVIYIPEGCYLECHALEDYFEFISIRFKVTTQLATDNFLQEYYRIQTVNNCGQQDEMERHFQEVYRNATSQNPQQGVPHPGESGADCGLAGGPGGGECSAHGAADGGVFL